MAHELDYSDSMGRHAMFSVKETPWHRLGIVLEDSPDVDSALRLGGLDFEVEKVPHFIRLDGLDGAVEYKRSGDAFSIVRRDRQEVIGTVGSTYEPLQQETAFGVLRPVVDQGLATIETAGVLRGGKQVWMLARFNLGEIVRRAIEQGGDPTLIELIANEVVPYGLFTNDHSGAAKARMKETAVRVVCANTFGMAMGKAEEGTSVEITHGKNIEELYRTAANMMLSGVAQRYAQLARARALLETTDLRGMEERPFRRLVLDPTVPIRHLERKVQRREDTVRTRIALDAAHGKRAEIRRLWDEGDGHTGSGSAWEAFQGLVQWTDHSSQSLNGQEERDERRATSLYDGTLGNIKSKVARGVFAYAAAENEDERLALLAD